MVIRSGTLFSVHPGSAYRSDRGEGWLTVLAVDKDYDLIAEVTGQPAETLPAHPARPDSRLLPHEGSARTRFKGVSQGHGCDREDQERSEERRVGKGRREWWSVCAQKKGKETETGVVRARYIRLYKAYARWLPI